MQLNLNEKSFHYINNLRRLILRTIYFKIFVRINKIVADKMIHSIFKKNVFLNWTTNDLKKISEKKLFELSINQIFEKHKIFITNNEIVISIIQNRILNEMITFTSNVISLRTSNKRSVSQNTMNTSFFFFIFDIIFFLSFRFIVAFRQNRLLWKISHNRRFNFFSSMWQKKLKTNCSKFLLISYILKTRRLKNDVRVLHQFLNSEKKRLKILKFFFVNCASFIIKWYETSEICHVYNKNATEKLNMTTNHSLKMLKQRLIYIY